MQTLENIFEQIEKGQLEMESDEICTYYFNEEDKTNRVVSVSSFNQLMALYSAFTEQPQFEKD